jgi:haloalkane dehalogenase
MKILRTPDERFEGLPGYDFAPRYLDVSASDGTRIRIHYVDEGPDDGDVVLLLHGEPSWSFLYRKMIPVIAAAGLRAVAPDLIGFGRSDKPASRTDYTYQSHTDWIGEFVNERDLRDITLFCQDWGGLLGLRLAAEEPERFARIVAANTFLPTGDMPLGEAFEAWRDYSQNVDDLDIGRVVNGGCLTDLGEDVLAGHNAPFPDDSYKQGARQFPALVPNTPDDPAAPANRKAWEVLSAWDKPFLTTFSDSDPITRGADLLLQSMIPGAQDMPHTTISGGGHFLQEDKGEEIAALVVDFVRSTPSA